MPQLNRLILKGALYDCVSTKDDEDYRALEIDMPHTDIGSITFMKHCYVTPSYIKIFEARNITIFCVGNIILCQMENITIGQRNVTILYLLRKQARISICMPYVSMTMFEDSFVLFDNYAIF